MAAARRSFVRRLASIPVLAVLLSAGLVVDVALAAAPTITSFSPQSGPVGTAVTINGTNFTGATQLKFKNRTASFTVDSDVKITATVPAMAQTGKISVTTPDGTALSATSFVVTATAAPTITTFSPTSGLPGAAVTINGTNFDGATSVTFNGVGASFTVNSSLKITATVPSGATTGPIRVTTPSGTAMSSTNFRITGAPTITSFSPTFGPVGTVVTINGTNFTGATDVRFKNKSATAFTVNSDTKITATVPSGAQSGAISVTTPSGTATSATDFTVSTSPPAPTITSFSPTSGAPGISVTINGTNFTGATSVKFNLTSANFTVDSDTKIRATVPNGATTGTISVTGPGGTATSKTAFTVPGTPTVGGFSPDSGPFDSRVVITGQSYSNVSAVKFNGVSASFTINSATQVTAIVPRGATTGPISVTNPNGTAFSDDPFTIKHLRRVTLSLSGSLRASGIVRVLDGTAACIDEVAVRIQRLVSGSWRTVGTTVTDEDGSYSVRVANREGRHRARTLRFTLDNGEDRKSVV